jgi:hypothetical protein
MTTDLVGVRMSQRQTTADPVTDALRRVGDTEEELAGFLGAFSPVLESYLEKVLRLDIETFFFNVF